MDHFQSSSIASKGLFGYCLFCSKLKTENTVTNHFKSQLKHAQFPWAPTKDNLHLSCEWLKRAQCLWVPLFQMPNAHKHAIQTHTKSPTRINKRWQPTQPSFFHANVKQD